MQRRQRIRPGRHCFPRRTIPNTPPPTAVLTTRQFATAQQVKDDVVNARVWAGLHWRNSVLAGETIGDSVAGWALNRYFGSTADETTGGENGDGQHGNND